MIKENVGKFQLFLSLNGNLVEWKAQITVIFAKE